MFRDGGKYKVIEFGYEKVVPQLVGLTYNHDDPTINNLRVAPDFALIDNEQKHVRLVEVKYRKQLEPNDTLKYANKMRAAWNPSYLFIATPYDFYFDTVDNIIKNQGHINMLDEIPDDRKAKYQRLLKDFET